jgi:signal transduction histidine kinase
MLLLKMPGSWLDVLAQVVSVVILIIRPRAGASYGDNYGVRCGKYGTGGSVLRPRMRRCGVQSSGANRSMPMKLSSIRQQLVFKTTLFVAVLLALIALGTYAYFRQATEALIVGQQFSMISNITRDLDHEINAAHKSLISAAEMAPPAIRAQPAATQRWLDGLAATLPAFGRGLQLLDPAGRQLAAVPAGPASDGKSFAGRDYFSHSMASLKPVISAPFVLIERERPVVVMTAFLRGEDGAVTGLLCGTVDLLENDGLFEVLNDFRVGATGYLYMFAPDRTMIMHPDHSRIMTQDVMPGANLLFDQALNGFEGSGQTVNSKGVAFLSSFKRLQSTGWILAANYQLSEAFAPITRFRDYFLLAMLLVLLLAVALAGRLGRGFAQPIEGFVRQLDALAKPGSDRTQRLDARRPDEFGVLAASFNGLLDEVQRREQELKEAQLQVLQSEKLASVGQLAAGVAHEINNPIGFVNSNLGSLKGQVHDLLQLLAVYRQAEPALAGHDDLLNAIAQARTDADIEFLQEDIVNLINESLDGVGRVKLIVDNLKDFSRVDSAEWQLARLENGLESALAIAWNEIKYKAEVRKDYAGLPEIECIVSQVNQVFLNLLVNAAQAIEGHGTITLRTGFDEHCVWVEIADSGTGIAPEHLHRIFDPFFTTQPVGQGTGLGLSLAYGIVKRHHGRLEVRSEPGKGSTFRVTLPRVRSEAEGLMALSEGAGSP